MIKLMSTELRLGKNHALSTYTYQGNTFD